MACLLWLDIVSAIYERVVYKGWVISVSYTHLDVYKRQGNDTYLNLTVDVMDIMTGLREDWGFKYPEEE